MIVDKMEKCALNYYTLYLLLILIFLHISLVMGFELGAWGLLGKYSSTLATSPALFNLSYLSDRVSLFAWGNTSDQSTYSYNFPGRFTSFLSGLASNYSSRDLYLLSSLNYRYEPSCLALEDFFFHKWICVNLNKHIVLCYWLLIFKSWLCQHLIMTLKATLIIHLLNLRSNIKSIG
jgi:hypothetical protein